MSTKPRMYCEREVIYRERAAFENGLIRGTAREFDGPGGGMAALKRAVARAFPLPKVTRPREVTDSHGVAWRVFLPVKPDVEPTIEYRDASRSGLIQPWRDALGAMAGQPGLTVEVARIVTELAANPTEEVEAE